MTDEQYAALSREEKEAWIETNHDLQHELNEAVHQARKLEIEARKIWKICSGAWPPRSLTAPSLN